MLATLRKNFRADLHEIFREGWQLANQQMINFDGDPNQGSGSGSVSQHCALAEVCTVPVLLVVIIISKQTELTTTMERGSCSSAC